MDYEVIDRWMSRGVVYADLRTTRFYLRADGLATDIPDSAFVFRTFADAIDAADNANGEPAWGELQGRWRASVPPLAFNPPCDTSEEACDDMGHEINREMRGERMGAFLRK